MKALILAFLLTLPVANEDVGDTRKPLQLETIASAIAETAATPEEAAMLIATGYEESKFSLRIHAGRCKPHECDGGKARGPWQVWRAKMPAKLWRKMHGLGNTHEQARQAQRRLMWGQAWCLGNEYGAMARYLGLSCSYRGPLIRRRLELYEKALNALRFERSAPPQ